MSAPAIAVVGAGGATGAAVVRALARRGDVAVRGVVRRAEAEQAAREAGAATVARADLADADALEAALDGADAVYVVPPVFHPQEDALVAGAVAAARRAGVGRFVAHSVLHPFTPAMRHHGRKARWELAVREAPLRWTILQPAMYAQTVLRSFRRSPSADAFLAPYSLDARFDVVDLDDVAEVAARVLVEPGHDAATYELAGPQRHALRELVDAIGRALGRPLGARVAAPGEVPVPAGFSRSQTADLHAMYAHYDAHGLTGNANVLRWLLGREPTSFEEVARRELAAAG
ncbi:NmrA family NAD(P)-binding protein [Conexibacter arvalis]|uniref:Uncharacterized protein YbjT (DUF2867 family) n=1 Tax=Conexibacter arvalis TaxID=912552 RepID=A0A840ID48_9ACTN|nr:uncharacterized protein YbjT (DUF2867 family) [Conexibacter arvalis]